MKRKKGKSKSERRKEEEKGVETWLRRLDTSSYDRDDTSEPLDTSSDTWERIESMIGGRKRAKLGKKGKENEK